MTLPPHWQEPAHLDVRTVTATGFPLVDEILQRRGIRDNRQADEFLNPDLNALADGTFVPGLDAVLDRLVRAIAGNQAILIFGDYDCDGITSTAILYSALCFASSDHRAVRWMLPERDTGYGLREEQVPRVREAAPDLLILIDCGSNDVETIAAVREAGIDVVVIDHHQISDVLPADVLLANPQLDQEGPARVLTAAGLAWLTVRRLEQRGLTVCRNGDGHGRYLDLAAIGTVADVAPLVGINRAIVREGLRQLPIVRREGLKALAREARFDLATIRAEDFPFKLTALLNGPGRLGKPDVALNLLLTPKFDVATDAAREVVATSEVRKRESSRALAGALAAAESVAEDRVLVVTGEDWHTGVLGPVATKLVERYGRPAVVMGGSGDRFTGSGRSVPGWDIAAAFRAVGEFVLHSGGHGGAAGLTVAREDLERFRAAINAYEMDVPVADVTPVIQIDGELGEGGLSYRLVQAIELLQPFGVGNPRPLLLWRHVQMAYLRAVGKDQTTVQAQIDPLGQRVKGVMFKGADRLVGQRTDQWFDLVVEPSLSTWNGATSVEARIVDFQVSG